MLLDVRNMDLAALFVLVFVITGSAHGSESIPIGAFDRNALSAALKQLPENVRGPKDLKVDLKALTHAYSGVFTHLSVGRNNTILLGLSDGTTILYDDGREKTFQQMLEDPDLQDMLSQVYPVGNVTEVPQDFDPGRIRVQRFFKALYGGTKAEVRRNLVNVKICGRTVTFNKRHGAAEALQRVGAELTGLLAKKPGLRQYVLPLAGTFSWRTIAGTDRLSPHCFGIAIDLNPKKGAYWKWNRGGFDIVRHRKQYPKEIIRIFESHGFIWGGTWHHYDTFHFEYRPVLLLKANFR